MSGLTSNESIVILGSGGHGWLPLKEYVSSCQRDVSVIMLPADWGGSTGTIGRMLELNNGELNKTLHNDTHFAVLPWGDYTKYIIEFSESFVLTSAMMLRSDSFEVLWEAISMWFQKDSVSTDVIAPFRSYLQTYLDYYIKWSFRLPYVHSTNLGNIWNQFLYFYCGGLEGMRAFYVSLGIIPSHIKHYFWVERRCELRGISLYQQNEYEVIGEDSMDVHNTPLLPESFIIADPYKGNPLNSVHADNEIYDIIQNANQIILPNGSIANWLPIINDKRCKDILISKNTQNSFIWLVNLFYGHNEFPAEIYYKYFKHQNILPLPLAPKEELQLSYSMYIDYLREGKTANTFYFAHKVFEIDTHTSTPRKLGLKHNQESVHSVLKEVSKNPYFVN